MKSEPVFLKTRWNYDSYQDVWELIELSGFKWIYIDEIDWSSDNTYILITLNGECPNPIPEDRKCKVIWTNLERPTEGYKMPRDDFDEVWVCDKKWADESGARFFFMASDKRLGYTGSHSNPPVSLAYVESRRVDRYSAMGLDNTNCFGTEKKELLSNAKALVVLHQDVPVLSPQRFCYSAASHLPVFYEEVPDFYPFVPFEDFIPINYDNCVSVVKDWLNNPKLQDIGENLYYKMCEKTNFRQEVERMFG